ncbi:MAG: F0F1 ATP synthase subunit B [Catalinimonas sp.]
MEIVTPGIGLIFWMIVTFLVVLFLLSKFAWKPIMEGLKTREEHINGALQSAQRAKEEMQRLQASNEALLQEARLERDQMLKDTKAASERMIAEAHDNAKREGDKMIEKARLTIETEKKAALAELKNQVAELSLDIAERVLRGQLDNPQAQQQLVERYIKEADLN